MSSADQRIQELLDRWLTSLELHLQYADLDDATYWQVQPWPKHDRPVRWILDVARQKVLELKTHCEARQSRGDHKFAEAIELTVFLSTLVGLQHIQRFIPIADPAKQQTITPAFTQSPSAQERKEELDNPDRTREMPQLSPAPQPQPRPTSVEEPTREMPHLQVNSAPAVPAAKTATTARSPAPPEPRKSAAKQPADSKPAAQKPASNAEMQRLVVTDAVRLLKWGKEWHELPDLIGRIADRPAVGEIRKILRSHKPEIMAKTAENS